jgi:conserved hypothetical protein
MNTNTNFDKIDKVLSKISGKELKSFVRVYSYTHDDFATALVEKYWKPERGNYKEQVEACFSHAGVLGKRFGEPDLDWRKIEKDLLAVMRKAASMRKKGNLIDAAIIAGYVMTTTCGEFERDHEHYKPVRYDLWAEENKVLKGIVNQAADMVRELLIQSDEIEEDSRLGMLGDMVKRCEEIGDNYFMRFEWFVDEAMSLLCGDDEKAYMAHISKRLKNRKEKYFHYRYYIQKADYWIAHGKRSKAEKLMMDRRDDENIRSHYINCLIEWKEYKKAIEIIDDNKNDFKAQYNKWENKAVEALKLSGDKEWLIEECRKRCITSGYKLKYYVALKEVVPKEEWKDFLNQLWDEIEWEHDYEDAEAQMAIKEKMLDRMKLVFVHKHWDLWQIFPKYIKYVPKKDQAFVGELMSEEIKRLALLKEKSKEFAWLLGEVKHVMGLSSIADEVIKDGIKKLIAEYPDKYYVKNYLGSVL